MKTAPGWILKNSDGRALVQWQALALNLIDEISTSDDLLLKAFENKQVIEVKYQEKRSLIQRIGLQAEASVEKLFAKLVNRRADVM